LQQLKRQGITILVSTPYMDEASLCDRQALLLTGKILQINTPQGIVNAFPYPIYAVRSSRMLPLLNYLKNDSRVADAYPFGEYHHVIFKKEANENALQNLVQPFQQEGVEWKKIQPDIEDCFMALMKV
ncbi:MAG: ABC transporter ATP-binding protein, partial [Flavisolibacter sp.]|nr:ABC transporter ATP-binding protein [Flavisolibacter sp.]